MISGTSPKHQHTETRSSTARTSSPPVSSQDRGVKVQVNDGLKASLNSYMDLTACAQEKAEDLFQDPTGLTASEQEKLKAIKEKAGSEGQDLIQHFVRQRVVAHEAKSDVALQRVAEKEFERIMSAGTRPVSEEEIASISKRVSEEEVIEVYKKITEEERDKIFNCDDTYLKRTLVGRDSRQRAMVYPTALAKHNAEGETMSEIGCQDLEYKGEGDTSKRFISRTSALLRAMASCGSALNVFNPESSPTEAKDTESYAEAKDTEASAEVKVTSNRLSTTSQSVGDPVTQSEGEERRDILARFNEQRRAEILTEDPTVIDEIIQQQYGKFGIDFRAGRKKDGAEAKAEEKSDSSDVNADRAEEIKKQAERAAEIKKQIKAERDKVRGQFAAHIAEKGPRVTSLPNGAPGLSTTQVADTIEQLDREFMLNLAKLSHKQADEGLLETFKSTYNAIEEAVKPSDTLSAVLSSMASRESASNSFRPVSSSAEAQDTESSAEA